MKQYKLHSYRLYRLKSGKYVAEVSYSASWEPKATHVKRFKSRNLGNAARAYQSLIEEYSK